MPKRFILLLLALIIPLSACSRTPEIPKTKGLVSSLQEAEISCPDGIIYSTDDPESSATYLSDRLLSTYFGIIDVKKYRDDWLSCTIFLSSGDSICEFAAIYCSTPEALIDTSRLFVLRVDSKEKLAHDKTYISRVTCIDNYAVLIVSKDPDTALRTLKKALK